jgi:hypothetical protein
MRYSLKTFETIGHGGTSQSTDHEAQLRAWGKGGVINLHGSFLCCIYISTSLHPALDQTIGPAVALPPFSISPYTHL